MKGSKRKDYGIAQNSCHCKVLEEALRREYGFQEIINVVFYLDNAGFFKPPYQGEKGVYVVSDKKPAFAPDVVKRKNKETVRSRKEVDALYCFLKTLTNPTGEKAHEHKQAVRQRTQLADMLHHFKNSIRYA